MPTPKCSCAISTLFFVSLSEQRASHTCKTVTVYSGVLCRQCGSWVFHITKLIIQTIGCRNRWLEKSCQVFIVCMWARWLGKRQMEKQLRNIFSHWDNETSSFSRNSWWCQTNQSMPLWKYHRFDSLIFIIQYSIDINYLICGKILLSSGNIKN